MGSIFPCFKPQIRKSNSLKKCLENMGQHFPISSRKIGGSNAWIFFLGGGNGQHFPYFDLPNRRIECMKKIGKNGQYFPYFDTQTGESNAWNNFGEKMGSISLLWPTKLENRIHETISGQILKNKHRTVLELVAHGPDGAMMICKMFPPAAPPPSRSHPWHRLLGPSFCAKDGGESGLRASYKVILT